MGKIIFRLLFITLLYSSNLYSQGYFSGDIQSNTDFYVRDTNIGAANTPHYDNLKSGTDTWIGLTYNNDDWKLRTGVRVDLFHNSNLHNPGTPYSGYGLGFWFVQKEVKGLEITGGNFYEQFGSGLTFRSYEDRSLGIDNALLGARLKFTYKDKLFIKGFTGVQKYRFELYKPVIKGLCIEGNFAIKDKAIFTPGIAVVNRTIDQKNMEVIVSNIESYDTSLRFVPKYNTYAFSFYNTLNAGNFTWFIEAAMKTHEALRGNGSLFDAPGNAVYTSFSYSKKKFGISYQFKRVENFQFRTSPNEYLLQGMVSFSPPTSRQNSLRLPSRFNAASQELNETAHSIDLTYTPKKGYTMNLSLSFIHNNKFQIKSPYFGEVYFDVEFKKNKKVQGYLGFQYVKYNQKFYTLEGDTIHSITGFGEISVKVNNKLSIRSELQYQYCPKDYGQWLFGLLEFNIAPHFSIAVSDMWNVVPNTSREDRPSRPLHFYSFFLGYTLNQHRFTASYVRQVSGIVCTGGVCRFEPAFSGLRISINSSF